MHKTCPHCGKDVPEYAKLYCFEDFSSKPPRKFPLGLAIGLFSISLLAVVRNRHLVLPSRKALIISESKALLVASSSRSGITADRIPFSNITHQAHQWW